MNANVRDILSVPGVLSVNPTSLTVAANRGTQLGIVHEVSIAIDQPYQFVHGEEYGERIEAIMVGQGCAIGFNLIAWDKDCLQRLFPNTAVGSTTGKRRVVAPSTIRAGEPVSDRSVVLLFTPDDTDRHPMFLMRRALPAIKETAEVAMKMDQEMGIPAIFYGIRDTNGKLYDWGLAHDLTL